MGNSLVTQEQLKASLHYDPDTGEFTWLRSTNSRRAGERAGTSRGGRIIIAIKRIKYRAHRLAFLYMTGEWPEHDVDHINGQPEDNRWINLRDVTHRTNIENQRTARADSSTGVLGVTWYSGKYVARITVHGVKRHLGRFADIAEAEQAYLTAKRGLHAGCTI